MCGKPVENTGDSKVRQWNSTLKADPGKRPRVKKKYIRHRRKSAPNLAETFRAYVLHRYPGYAGQAVPCDNCRHKIRTLKFENISHIKTRGARPDLAHDFSNFEILCSFNDYPGAVKDESCHTLWERKRWKQFEAKRKGQPKHGKDCP